MHVRFLTRTECLENFLYKYGIANLDQIRIDSVGNIFYLDDPMWVSERMFAELGGRIIEVDHAASARNPDRFMILSEQSSYSFIRDWMCSDIFETNADLEFYFADKIQSDDWSITEG